MAVQVWTCNEVHQPAIRAFLAGRHASSKQLTLAERIERLEGAMTAVELSELLGVSKVTLFKMAKAGGFHHSGLGRVYGLIPGLWRIGYGSCDRASMRTERRRELLGTFQ